MTDKQMINQRLFDWHGIDTKKNLGLKTFCPRPYDTVLIDKMGSCYLCECTSWLPQSVGNLHIQSLGDILNSKLAWKLRGSIANGSYRYCNTQRCSYFLAKGTQHLHFKKTLRLFTTGLHESGGPPAKNKESGYGNML